MDFTKIINFNFLTATDEEVAELFDSGVSELPNLDQIAQKLYKLPLFQKGNGKVSQLMSVYAGLKGQRDSFQASLSISSLIDDIQSAIDAGADFSMTSATEGLRNYLDEQLDGHQFIGIGTYYGMPVYVFRNEDTSSPTVTIHQFIICVSPSDNLTLESAINNQILTLQASFGADQGGDWEFIRPETDPIINGYTCSWDGFITNAAEGANDYEFACEITAKTASTVQLTIDNVREIASRYTNSNFVQAVVDALTNAPTLSYKEVILNVASVIKGMTEYDEGNSYYTPITMPNMETSIIGTIVMLIYGAISTLLSIIFKWLGTIIDVITTLLSTFFTLFEKTSSVTSANVDLTGGVFCTYNAPVGLDPVASLGASTKIWGQTIFDTIEEQGVCSFGFFGDYNPFIIGAYPAINVHGNIIQNQCKFQLLVNADIPHNVPFQSVLRDSDHAFTGVIKFAGDTFNPNYYDGTNALVPSALGRSDQNLLNTFFVNAAITAILVLGMNSLALHYGNSDSMIYPAVLTYGVRAKRLWDPQNGEAVYNADSGNYFNIDTLIANNQLEDARSVLFTWSAALLSFLWNNLVGSQFTSIKDALDNWTHFGDWEDALHLASIMNSVLTGKVNSVFYYAADHAQGGSYVGDFYNLLYVQCKLKDNDSLIIEPGPGSASGQIIFPQVSKSAVIRAALAITATAIVAAAAFVKVRKSIKSKATSSIALAEQNLNIAKSNFQSNPTEKNRKTLYKMNNKLNRKYKWASKLGVTRYGNTPIGTTTNSIADSPASSPDITLIGKLISNDFSPE